MNIKNNSFVTRLISGVVLVAAALATIIPGGLPLLAVSLFLSLVGMRELLKALLPAGAGRTDGKQDPPLLPEAIGYAGIVLYYAALLTKREDLEIAAIVFCLLVLLICYVFSWPKYTVQTVMAVIFAVLYTGFLFSCVYRTRMLPHGEYIVWLIFLSSWGSDTCAYCVGMLFGKHKMTPKLSPKKTVEGGVGGIAGAVLLALIYGALTEKPVTTGTPGLYALICGAGALLSMVGDLAASAIKREAGIKDYGKLIPGHGGVMDRFDSVIVTAPVIYFLAVIFG